MGRSMTFFVWTILLLGGAATVFGPVLGSMLFWAVLMLIRLHAARLVPETVMRTRAGRAVRLDHRGRHPDAAHHLPTTRDTRRQEGAGDQCPLTRTRGRRSPAVAPQEPGSAPSPTRSSSPTTSRGTFGGMTAVDVDHLEVQRGAITALIGPNGAGKTTLFNLLTGFDKPSSGTLDVRGPLAAAASPAAKVARDRHGPHVPAHQGALAHDRHREHAARRDGPARARTCSPRSCPPVWRAREREITEQAEELLARFKLDTKRDDFAGSLSGGQRKLLEMARALMSKPTMVMLDEPMAGVNPALTQSLLGHIQALRDDGTTVLFVEHDMHMVRHISDWVVVMAEGRIVAEGPPESVMHDAAVIDAYLGAHHDTDLGDDRLLDRRRVRAARGRDPGRGGATMSTAIPVGPAGGGGADPAAIGDGGPGPPRRSRRAAAAGRDRPGRRLPARRQHPQRVQPRGAPRRARRHHRPERRRQVDAAQGAVRARERPVRAR